MAKWKDQKNAVQFGHGPINVVLSNKSIKVLPLNKSHRCYLCYTLHQRIVRESDSIVKNNLKKGIKGHYNKQSTNLEKKVLSYRTNDQWSSIRALPCPTVTSISLINRQLLKMLTYPSSPLVRRYSSAATKASHTL